VTAVVLVLAVATVCCSLAHAIGRASQTLWVSNGLVALTVVLAIPSTISGLILAFKTAEHVAAADKATVLSASIADAMNSLIFAGAALVLFIPGVVAGEVRRRRRARAPQR
jgi:hypothetical protein